MSYKRLNNCECIISQITATALVGGVLIHFLYKADLREMIQRMGVRVIVMAREAIYSVVRERRLDCNSTFRPIYG